MGKYRKEPGTKRYSPDKRYEVIKAANEKWLNQGKNSSRPRKAHPWAKSMSYLPRDVEKFGNM
jgi:hypothetical protein